MESLPREVERAHVLAWGLFGQMGQPAVMFTDDGHCIAVNQAAQAALSTPDLADTGELWNALGLSGEDQADVEARFAASVATGRRDTGHVTTLRGAEVEYSLIPSSEEGDLRGVTFTFIDVTERAMGRALNETLNDVYCRVLSSRPIEETVPGIVELAGRALGVDAVAVGVREGDRLVLRYAHGRLERLEGRAMDEGTALKAFPCLVSMEPHLVDDLGGEAAPGTEVLQEAGVASMLTLPLVAGGPAIGVLSFGYRQHSPTMHPIQRDFAHKLAVALSLALEREALLRDERERAELLRQVIEGSPAGIALLDFSTMEVELSNSLFVEHMRGQTRFEEMPQEFQRVICGTIARSMEVGAAQAGHEYEVRLGGRETYWSFSSAPMPGGKVLLVSSDVTLQVQERRRYQELARREEQERRRLRTILDTLPLGVLVVDAEGRTVESNRQKRPGLNGADNSTTRGRWSDTGMAIGQEEWPAHRALRGETTTGAMVDMRRPDGSMGTVLISAAPVRDDRGRVVGAVSAMQDVTEQRRLEQEALEAKQKAELYLDVLSHDVNNLNAAAKGYLELHMAREEMTESGRKKLENSERALEQISELIDSVRKLQEMERRGRAHGLVDLGPVLNEAAESARRAPGRDVRVDYRPSVKKFVMANELIKDLFDNLLSNAVRHSHDPVEITVRVSQQLVDGREYYRVDVEDNGPGIPDELKARLFNRFARGETRAGGRGLGLYLVRKITEEYGGKVWVEDRVPGDSSKGSRFVVCLPMAIFRSGTLPQVT